MRSFTSLTTLAFLSLGLGACATGATGPLTATNNPSP